MTERERRQLAETVEFINDPRTRAEIIEAGPMYLLVEFDCRGAVQQPDGTIEIVPRHRVRFVRAEGHHGLLPLYEPIGGEIPFHPNVRCKGQPYLICANLEEQLARGPAVPYFAILSLVYDMIAGAAYASAAGIYNAEALAWYTSAHARGELPFEKRTLR